MSDKRGKGFTVSNRAVASNPGRLAAQPLFYFRCFPAEPLCFAGLCLAAAAFARFARPEWAGTAAWLLAGMAAITVLAVFLGPVRVREHFRMGCLNPAVVVSHDPDLVAVYSDLSAGGEPWPVVKLLHQPLKRMTGGRPAVGARLATVALYTIGPLPNFWADFTPIVVNCATRDTAAIQECLARIEAREWAAMEEALRQVPRPYKRGLYKVELPYHLQWVD